MKVNYPRSLSLCVLSACLIVFCHTRSQSAYAQDPQAATSPSPSAPASGAAPAHDDRYRIGPDDVLEVRVFNRPQLTRDSVRVDGRGTIRMPLIEGDLKAACLTESELSDQIAKQYLEYLKNPQVDVFVKEFNSKPVSLVGAVARPGRFQLQRRVRLLELLTLGGGPTPAAGRFVQIIRADNAQLCDDDETDSSIPQSEGNVVSINLSQVLQGNEQANPYLQPGDVVSLPDVDQIFVVGNVYKPSIIPLREPMTVSSAVAIAGGMLENSQRDKVRIIRQVSGKAAKIEIIVDLKAINRRGETDVSLQAGDIVEVPISGKGRFKRLVTYALAPALIYMPTSILR